MSPVTLDELAAAEAEIEGVVTSIEGTIEEKTARLESEGVFARYSAVFSAYLSLAEPPRSDVEALKRAAFIAWYELTEPPRFSGVSGLPNDARQRVAELVEPIVSELDDEFRWMLAYYFDIANYAFPNLPSFPQLKTLLESEDSDAWETRRPQAESMAGRGLMGEYWVSVFVSGAV